MKYVIMAVVRHGQVFEYPIIFPDALTHKDVAVGMMSTMIELMGERRQNVSCTAAGFIPSMAIAPETYGKSESLNTASMPDDGDFIHANDYCASLRSNAAMVSALTANVMAGKSKDGE